MSGAGAINANETGTDAGGVVVRALAFDLWRGAGGRNAAAVARLLADRGLAVPARTVQHWARSEDWHGRLVDAARTAAPALLDADAAELAAIRSPAVRYLGRVAAGLEDSPDVEELARAVGHLDDSDRATAILAAVKAHADARRVRVGVCFGILDRTGFPPGRAAVSTAKDAGRNLVSVGSTLPLSEEERRRLADGRAALAATLDGFDGTGDG